MAAHRASLVWPCDKEKVIHATVMAPADNPDIIRGMSDVKDVVVLENGWKDGHYIVKLDIESDAEVPGAVRSLLGGKKIGWVQRGVYNPADDSYTVGVTPNYFATNLKVHTVGRVKPLPNGHTEMTLEFEAHCNIPILGGLIEKLIVQKVSNSLLKQYQQDIHRLSQG